MTHAGHTGRAQSVMTRLNTYAKKRNLPPHYVLARFGVERLLYRLSKTPEINQFVLKGATLMPLWLGDAARPTRDVDLAGYGTISEKSLRSLFAQICSVQDAADAIVFDPDSVDS